MRRRHPQTTRNERRSATHHRAPSRPATGYLAHITTTHAAATIDELAHHIARATTRGELIRARAQQGRHERPLTADELRALLTRLADRHH